MAYWTYHKNNKTGVVYVYEATSVWDKEKKQAKNKQICIGKLDPITEEFIPNKRRLATANPSAEQKVTTAAAKIYGVTLILDAITEELDMKKRLSVHFPDTYLQILSIVYYLIHKSTPLSHIENWSKNHIHPYGAVITGQETDKLLQSQEEDARKSFFNEWQNTIFETEYLCFNIASLSEHAVNNEFTAYEYNRECGGIPRINLVMLFGQRSSAPIYFERLPKSVPDIKKLTNLLDALQNSRYSNLHLILDRDFYNEENITGLINGKYNFIIGASAHLKWIQKIIDEYRNQIEAPEYYYKFDDEAFFVKTKFYCWGEQKEPLYIHVYYNARRAAIAKDEFMRKLHKCRQELETNRRRKSNETFYSEYFIVNESSDRGLTVRYNNSAVGEYCNHYVGYFILLSNDFKDPISAFETYRNKDIAENYLYDLKNQFNMTRLKEHSSASMDTRLFLQFIALIYTNALNKRMRKSKSLYSATVRELLESMESYIKVTYTGRYGYIYTELTEQQRVFLNELGISAET